jgi:uncharacterized metal-binding protein
VRTKLRKQKSQKLKEVKMKTQNNQLTVEATDGKCPVGEKTAKQNEAEGKIPVLSCEGGCIRGEIARLAANMVAKEEPYRRSCHGELFTIPHSAISHWTKNADKVVLIDGCFLRCHGRILRNIVDKDRLVEFDALSHYKKYTDIFEIDGVPEEERKTVARDVADWVLDNMKKEDKIEKTKESKIKGGKNEDSKQSTHKGH